MDHTKTLKKLAAIQFNPTHNELARARAIAVFANTLFGHTSYNKPSAFDAVTIITEARAGKQFRCVEYSIVASTLMNAYGIKARMIGLRADVATHSEAEGGHVTIEFWSSEFGKWVMCDVQVGIIPYYHQAPLSTHELYEKLQQNNQPHYTLISNPRATFHSQLNGLEYSDWIGPYLYSISVLELSEIT